MAKTRQIDCKQCGERVKRQYGYFRRGWELGKTQYRMVYKCPKCGTSMALLTIEEDDYRAHLKWMHDRYLEQLRKVLALEIKLDQFERDTEVRRTLSQIEKLKSRLTRLEHDLKLMC